MLWWMACAPVEPVVPVPTAPSTLEAPTPTGLPDLPTAVAPVKPAWPSLAMPVSDRVLASPFGPRSSDGRDEMHLGLDWAGVRGEPIHAALPGTVRTVRIPSRPSQSLFVILEHPVEPFEWQGGTHDRLYTSYHHLDDTQLVEGVSVAAGDVVGRMGDSGNAETVHLHFELRVGTHCSLPYQLENPDSSCAAGFAPEVDPMMLLPVAQVPITLSVEGLRVTVHADRDDPGIRRVETPLGQFDLATWEGLDPSSDAALDDLTLDWVTMVPIDTDADRVLHLDFPEPPDWIRIWDGHGNLVEQVLR
jgi:hypothetical protein